LFAHGQLHKNRFGALLTWGLTPMLTISLELLHCRQFFLKIALQQANHLIVKICYLVKTAYFVDLMMIRSLSPLKNSYFLPLYCGIFVPLLLLEL